MEDRFAQLAQDRILAIERSFVHRCARIEQLAAFFTGSEDVTREEFRVYVASMAAEASPGWQVQWIPYVQGPQRAAIEERARREGVADYAFRESDSAGRLIPAGSRDSYYPIHFMEPFDRFPSAYGLDLSTVPRRFAVLEKARDSGSVAVSSRCSFQPLGPDRSAILIAVPVYRGGLPTTVEARRTGLQGFAVGVLKISSLLEEALQRLDHPAFVLRIEDSAIHLADPFVWDYTSGGTSAREIPSLLPDDPSESRLRCSTTIPAGDRVWNITCAATAEYEASQRSLSPWILLLLGLVLTATVANQLRSSALHTQGLLIANQRLVQEIGERQRIADTLKASEQRFYRTFNASPLPMWLATVAEGTFLEINNAFLRDLGYSRSETVGRTCLSLGIWASPGDRTAMLQKLEAEGAIHDMPSRVRAKSGRVLDMMLSAERLLVEQTECLLVCAYDVTQKKKVDEELARYRGRLEEQVAENTRELEESREQLRRSERLASIGTLASGIAHEINNPVGTMLLAAENAMELWNRRAENALIGDCLKGVIEEARRCAEVIRSLLQFARQERTEKSEVSIAHVIQRSVELTAAYAQQHGATIDVIVPDHLPNTTVNTLQMEQVFVNLLRNAIETGRRGVQISIRAAGLNGRLRVTVEDNGPGIPEAHLARVFDPFFTTRRERGGTGLGLSIVHGIIVEHGGEISVQSRLGGGAVFTIDLPLNTHGNPEDSHGQSADS